MSSFEVQQMTLTQTEYTQILAILGGQGIILSQLDLESFLKMAKTADSSGSFLDPTLYLLSHKANSAVIEMTEAVMSFVEKFLAFKEIAEQTHKSGTLGMEN